MAGERMQMCLVVLLTVVGISSAATLTVGDSTGWTIPTSSSFYPNWASKQNIQVGDSLVFKFPAGSHTVAEVSKSAYDSCSTASPISAVLATAPANITIGSAGTHYYICTISGHCSFGQKLAVTATGASPAPKATKKASSPAPSLSPPTSTSTAPSAVPAAGPSGIPATPAGDTPAGPTASPPKGNSAATNAAGFGLVGLISAAVAAFLV